jgi:methylated-DNA-[protein]-cysteine S-methyltransferase
MPVDLGLTPEPARPLASGDPSTATVAHVRESVREKYAAVAAAAGRPRAVRAVGAACAANPLPIIVPCHRVVRSDGSPGGYLGGPEAKRLLLALEAR